jgi:hypothetical protein
VGGINIQASDYRQQRTWLHGLGSRVCSLDRKDLRACDKFRGTFLHQDCRKTRMGNAASRMQLRARRPVMAEEHYTRAAVINSHVTGADRQCGCRPRTQSPRGTCRRNEGKADVPDDFVERTCPIRKRGGKAKRRATLQTSYVGTVRCV